MHLRIICDVTIKDSFCAQCDMNDIMRLKILFNVRLSKIKENELLPSYLRVLT